MFSFSSVLTCYISYLSSSALVYWILRRRWLCSVVISANFSVLSLRISYLLKLRRWRNVVRSFSSSSGRMKFWLSISSSICFTRACNCCSDVRQVKTSPRHFRRLSIPIVPRFRKRISEGWIYCSLSTTLSWQWYRLPSDDTLVSVCKSLLIRMIVTAPSCNLIFGHFLSIL